MSDRPLLPLALPTFAVVAGALATYWYYASPLRSARPTGAGASAQTMVGEQQFEARLWQDPFQTAADGLKLWAATPEGKQLLQAEEASLVKELGGGLRAEGGDSTAPPALERVLRWLAPPPPAPDAAPEAPPEFCGLPIAATVAHQIAHRQAEKKTVLVLPVLVDNSPYAENTEWRLRARYAVLSGLCAGGYAAADGKHIGVARQPWFESGELEHALVHEGQWLTLPSWPTPVAPVAVIPFEWFERDLVPRTDGARLAAGGGSAGGSSASGPATSPAGAGVRVRRPDSVLVLWLDDDLFAYAPATRMGQLLGALREQVRQQLADRGMHPEGVPEYEVAVLGPDSSTTLRAMDEDPLLRDWSSLPGAGGAKDGRARLNGVRWYAPRPTAPTPLLRSAAIRRDAGRLAAAGAGTDSPHLLRYHAGTDLVVEVERVGNSDDEMSRELLEELDRRGVDLAVDGDAILILSEWDTYYGRTLPAVFSAELEARRRRDHRAAGKVRPAPSVDSPVRTGHDRALVQQVRFYTYMRGLDGMTSSDAAGRAGDDAKGREREPRWAPRDPPDGTVQVDYVRRLVVDIKADRGDDPRRSGSAVKAIGVLGSDVYDKLLLLRALRHEFPGAIFFTTDLDNRLLFAEELEYTRNLVVVSPFGLSLRPEIQGPVPPFRDSYQAGMFLASLRAVGVEPERPASSPRVFEVGRGGAYDLSPDGGAVHPAPPRPPEWARLKRSFGQVVLLALAGALLLMPVSRRLRVMVFRRRPSRAARRPGAVASDNAGAPGAAGAAARDADRRRRAGLARQVIDRSDRSESRRVLLLMVGTVVCGVALAAIIHVDGWRPGGEPFALARGISIWPTQALRLAAMLLAVYFLVQGYHTLHRNAAELSLRYDLPLPRWQGTREAVGKWFARARSRAASRAGESPHPRSRLWRWLPARPLRGPRCWLPWRVRRTVASWADRCAERATRFAPYLPKAPPAAATPAPEDGVTAPPPKGEPPGVLTARRLWRQYGLLGSRGNRLWRVIPLSVAFCVLGVVVVSMLGPPLRPFRGGLSDWTDRVLLAGSAGALVLLTFFVLDAIRLCEVFCRTLAGQQTPWHPAVKEDMALERGVDPDDTDELLDVHVIGERTEAVGRLIFAPFAVLTLMVVARASLFDRWEWPVTLVAIFTLILVYAVWSLFALHRAAERARQDAMGRLGVQLMRASAAGQPGGRAEQLALAIKEIETYRRGAFAPLTQHPLVVALIIPFGGTGIVTLIELFATFA